MAFSNSVKNNILSLRFCKLLSLYFIPFILSFFIGFLYLYIFDGDKLRFLEINMFGRFFNVFLFLILSLYISSLVIYKKIELKNICLAYVLGCFILILTAYWQAISIYLGLIPFPFETRNWVHGFNKEEYEIQSRITGIAAEPSYFVPFVVDFLILLLICFKSKVLKVLLFLLGVFILTLSFSPSGYGSFIFSFLMAYLMVMKWEKKYIKITLISSFLLVSLSFILLFSGGFTSLNYVFERLINLSEDGRFKSFQESLNYFFESNVLNIFFGFGPTNFQVSTFNSNYSALKTSNNLFLDILVEMGLVGLISLLVLFYKLFVNIVKSNFSDFQKFVGFSLFFDLLITSMIRSDYSTSRFFILLVIIYLIGKIDLRVKHEN